ncbi:MAG: prenyltransferase/squalene oxidase repeat-containing protein [Planctomycetota bacterium]
MKHNRANNTVLATKLHKSRHNAALRFVIAVAAFCTGLCEALWPTAVAAEAPMVRYGDPVPRDVREIYDAGLRYLVRTQEDSGMWKGGQEGPGITGMATMVLLASGEDPNYGPYREPIRKALRNIISQQDAATGFVGASNNPSMYHHGFAMLALAEAYGAVDDRTLWAASDAASRGRLIGPSLELAVRMAVTSGKKNPFGGWRYSPDAQDADTSVSGAVLMGLLAARNAGIEVPIETIDKAIGYYQSMTGPNGQIGYSGQAGGGSDAVTSIGVLVYSIAGRKDLPQFKQAIAYLRNAAGNPRGRDQNYPSYTRYYRSQALFQADVDTWVQWNDGLIKEIKASQAKDGSIVWPGGAGFGPAVETSLTLLSLALNYRFLPIYER